MAQIISIKQSRINVARRELARLTNQLPPESKLASLMTRLVESMDKRNFKKGN